MEENIPINKDNLINLLGFTHNKSLIQESFSYTIEDHHSHDDLLNSDFYHFKQLSLSLCNDYGKNEYYVFIREGYSNRREEDDVVTLSKNYQFIHQVKNLLDCLLIELKK
jgi:hypothetical protein